MEYTQEQTVSFELMIKDGSSVTQEAIMELPIDLQTRLGIHYSASEDPNKEEILKKVRTSIQLRLLSELGFKFKVEWCTEGPIKLKDIFGNTFGPVIRGLFPEDMSLPYLQRIDTLILDWRDAYVSDANNVFLNEDVREALLASLDTNQLVELTRLYGSRVTCGDHLIILQKRISPEHFCKVLKHCFISRREPCQESLINFLPYDNEIIFEAFEMAVHSREKHYRTYVNQAIDSIDDKQHSDIVKSIMSNQHEHKITFVFNKNKRFIIEATRQKVEFITNKNLHTKTVEEAVLEVVDIVVPFLARNDVGHSMRLFKYLLEKKKEETLKLIEGMTDFTFNAIWHLMKNVPEFKITTDMLISIGEFFSRFLGNKDALMAFGHKFDVDSNRLMETTSDCDDISFSRLFDLLLVNGVKDLEFRSLRNRRTKIIGFDEYRSVFKTDTDYLLAAHIYDDSLAAAALRIKHDGLNRPFSRFPEKCGKHSDHLRFAYSKLMNTLSCVMLPTKEGLNQIKGNRYALNGIARHIPAELALSVYTENRKLFSRLFINMDPAESERLYGLFGNNVPYHFSKMCWTHKLTHLMPAIKSYLMVQNEIKDKVKFAEIITEREDIIDLKHISETFSFSECGNNLELFRFLIEQQASKKENLDTIVGFIGTASELQVGIICKHIKLNIPEAPKGEERCQICDSDLVLYGCPAKTQNCALACCGCTIYWMINKESCPHCRQSFTPEYSFV